MSPLFIGGALALGAWLFGTSKAASTSTSTSTSTKRDAPSPDDLAKRIATEAAEIVDGKRDTFTPVDNGGDDVDEMVRKAVEEIDADADSVSAAVVEEADQSASAPQPAEVTEPIETTAEEIEDAVAETNAEDASSPEPEPISAPSGPSIPPGYDPDGARSLAPSLATHIARTKYDYDRRLVRSFQTKAGIAADKNYGPETRGALIYFGVANPPQPLFKGADGTTKTVPYVPPEQRA